MEKEKMFVIKGEKIFFELNFEENKRHELFEYDKDIQVKNEVILRGDALVFMGEIDGDIKMYDLSAGDINRYFPVDEEYKNAYYAFLGK